MTIPISLPSLRCGFAAVAMLAATAPGQAADAALAPQTRLRVTIVQWMPMKGAYEQWSALGGEFTVTDDATVVLPVIGAVPVGTSDAAALATDISRRLQAAIGTVDKPDTTVEILDYPPVYVVGDVKTPGAYGFRAGLTVLQALALGGGEEKGGAERSRDQIRLVGELRGLENDMLRASARIARLRAEMAGAPEIAFPPAPQDAAGGALAAEVFAQERTIFLARANELDRQTRSLTELRQLLNAEIGVIEQKIVAVDAGIAAAEKELRGVTVLVEKGIAVAARQSDLERALAGHRADRLDQVTAVMRARQGVAETTRNLDGLRDRRQTEIAAELQKEQSGLEQTLLKRDMAQKLLLDLLSSGPAAGGGAPAFAVVRREGGRAVDLPAMETTLLRPGDVVRVTSRPAPEPGPSPTDADIDADGASQ